MAYAGCGTGEIAVQPDGIGGRSKIADPCNAAFDIRNNLVHANHQNDMTRSLDQTGYTISVAVNIDQFAV